MSCSKRYVNDIQCRFWDLRKLKLLLIELRRLLLLPSAVLGEEEGGRSRSGETETERRTGWPESVQQHCSARQLRAQRRLASPLSALCQYYGGIRRWKLRWHKRNDNGHEGKATLWGECDNDVMELTLCNINWALFFFRFLEACWWVALMGNSYLMKRTSITLPGTQQWIKLRWRWGVLTEQQIQANIYFNQNQYKL